MADRPQHGGVLGPFGGDGSWYYRVAVVSDGSSTFTVFDRGQERIVLYTVPDPDGGGDIECAVTLHEILAGDTSTCWRGDNFAAYTAPWRPSRA